MILSIITAADRPQDEVSKKYTHLSTTSENIFNIHSSFIQCSTSSIPNVNLAAPLCGVTSVDVVSHAPWFLFGFCEGVHKTIGIILSRGLRPAKS